MRTSRWAWITLVSLAGCGWRLNGQTLIDLTRQARLGSGTALPAQCAVGQVFFKSNAPGGANLYTCIAQNSWTGVGLSQGTAASRPANCTFGQIWLSTDTGAMTYCSATGSPGTWSPTLAGPAGVAGTNGAISQIDAGGAPLTIRPILNFVAGANCVDNSGANRTDCTFSGGGSGSVVLTSGSGVPSANCAGPSSSNLAVYLDTSNQDEWWCSATNTWKKILSVTGSGPYEVVGGTGTAPGAPPSGSVACYFDSTTTTQVCLNSSGNAFTMIKGASSASHQFVTNVDASGVQHQSAIALGDVPAGVTVTIASGTAAMGTGAISSATCATAVTVTATGTATTDVVNASFNNDPTAVTGYIPATSGMLTILAYPSSGAVNFKVCNNTAGTIAPGAITLNWRVVR